MVMPGRIDNRISIFNLVHIVVTKITEFYISQLLLSSHTSLEKAALTSQHRKLQDFAGNGFCNNFGKQISNFFEELYRVVSGKIKWNDATLFWSDKKIIQYLKEETDAINASSHRLDRLQDVIKIVSNTAESCIASIRATPNKRVSDHEIEELNLSIIGIANKSLPKPQPSKPLENVATILEKSSEPIITQSITKSLTPNKEVLSQEISKKLVNEIEPHDIVIPTIIPVDKDHPTTGFERGQLRHLEGNLYSDEHGLRFFYVNHPTNGDTIQETFPDYILDKLNEKCMTLAPGFYFITIDSTTRIADKVNPIAWKAYVAMVEKLEKVVKAKIPRISLLMHYANTFPVVWNHKSLEKLFFQPDVMLQLLFNDPNKQLVLTRDNLSFDGLAKMAGAWNSQDAATRFKILEATKLMRDDYRIGSVDVHILDKAQKVLQSKYPATLLTNVLENLKKSELLSGSASSSSSSSSSSSIVSSSSSSSSSSIMSVSSSSSDSAPSKEVTLTKSAKIEGAKSILSEEYFLTDKTNTILICFNHIEDKNALMPSLNTLIAEGKIPPGVYFAMKASTDRVADNVDKTTYEALNAYCKTLGVGIHLIIMHYATNYRWLYNITSSDKPFFQPIDSCQLLYNDPDNALVENGDRTLQTLEKWRKIRNENGKDPEKLNNDNNKLIQLAAMIGLPKPGEKVASFDASKATRDRAIAWLTKLVTENPKITVEEALSKIDEQHKASGHTDHKEGKMR